jgi:hypothetical protein
MRRELETELRWILTGHERGNPGNRQAFTYVTTAPVPYQQDHGQRHRRSSLPVSCDERHRSSDQDLPHAKKAGTLPVENSEEVKRTNEIKMAIPLRDAIDVQGTDVSADALLTQSAS